MSVLTCKMCGGDLEPTDGATTARCPYCGTIQTIPRLDSEQRIRLYERANHFRRRNDYDMAMAVYEQVSGKEPPYDIFICYREVDEKGRRTKDSVLADEVYYHLSREGYRVFFSRITLRDKPGEAYEPCIFAALHSAKVMIVIATDPKNLQSVWVKNEWSRYLALIKKGEAKVLIPAYRDMDPYDLPDEFSHLQALNMAQLGFMQDLLYGIRKMIGEKPRHTNDWGPYAWKRGVLIGIVLVAAALLISSKGIYRRIQMNLKAKDAKITQTEQEPEFRGILAAFLSQIYQVPAKNVTENQLAKIRQLTIRREIDSLYIGYSFEEPGPPDYTLTDSDELFENRNEELTWMEFPEDITLDLDCLYRFTGLKKLNVHSTLSANQVKGLQLESVSAFFDNPAEVSSILENPKALKELGLHHGVNDLDGIDDFVNLESLYLDSSEIKNIDALIYLKNLKHLRISGFDHLSDYAVIEKLPALETLRLDSCSLRSAEWIGHLKNLKMLGISFCQIPNLSGLENCASLTSLSITDCFELKDVSTVEALTGLQELALDVQYGCPEPKLENLSGLEKLFLANVHDCTFIENLPELTELHLVGCTLPDAFDASKLSSLKTLSCTFRHYDKELTAIEDIQSLEKIDMQGSEAYVNLAGIFNMPNLRELNLNNVQCEIKFDEVMQNTSLEILHMNHVVLYQDVNVENDGGQMSIYYDDVELTDHLDFFEKFPFLKELHLCESGLTDLSFAEGVPTLEVLDISDNYITTLSPLTGLPSLRKVICKNNPLKSTEGLKDSVLVITQSQIE